MCSNIIANNNDDDDDEKYPFEFSIYELRLPKNRRIMQHSMKKQRQFIVVFFSRSTINIGKFSIIIKVSHERLEEEKNML